MTFRTLKKIVLATALFALPSAQASQEIPTYFKISKIEVKEIKEKDDVWRTKANSTGGHVGIGAAACNGVAKAGDALRWLDNGSGKIEDVPGLDPAEILAGEATVVIDAIEIVFDRIVNLGKKVWNLVDAGKPNFNMQSNVATALPYGARCWMDLESWEAPQSKTYSVSYKNGFGAEVVKFVYRVIYVAGGSINGRGAYIGYATIQPADVKIAWGFDFEAQVEIPTVYNMGTKEDPLAGMTMNLRYVVKPKLKLKHQEVTMAYHITGDGELVRLD